MSTLNIQQLIADFPLVEKLIALDDVSWFNPNISTLTEGLPYVGFDKADKKMQATDSKDLLLIWQWYFLKQPKQMAS